MAGNEIFSTAMRGYKKDEVVSYIADLSDQMQQLKYDLDRKEVEIDRLNKEIQSLQAATAEPDEQAISALREEIRVELESAIRAEFEKKLDEELAKRPDPVPDENERKAREYDACKDTLADLMIQARRNADDVVEKAKSEAQMLRAKSEAEFSQLGANFSALQQKVGSLRLDLQQNLDNISEQIDLFEEQLFGLQKDVDDTIAALHQETNIQ